MLLTEELPQFPAAVSAETLDGSPVIVTIEFDDADAVFTAAHLAGGTIERPIEEMFWEARHGHGGQGNQHNNSEQDEVEDHQEPVGLPAPGPRSP